MSPAVAFLFVIVATSVAGPSGCAALNPIAADSVDATGNQAGTQVELRVAESFRLEARRTTITFVGVTEDSRCPTGVTCVWEGDAVAELSVAADGSPAAVVQLHANQQFAQEAAAHGLRIRLERLEPYPEAERPVPAGEYRVVLLIATE